jgi:acylphosphatase
VAEASERAEMVITGRVQGVFFRQSALEQAMLLGLSGYVRNREDGSVGTVAEGPRAALEAYWTWCQRGPRGARVAAVSIRWAPATGEYSDFRIAF